MNDLDEQVARKLGYKKVKGPFGNPTLGTIHREGWKWPDGRLMQIIPAFSTEIEAAWEIVEFVMAGGNVVSIVVSPSDVASVQISYGPGVDDHITEDADTAPMAIVKCFLKLDAIEAK